MKILITGARGFIGSHLGNRLTQLGHDVTGIDNGSNVSDNQCVFYVHESEYQDLFLSFSAEEINGFDAIFHLAASINVDESIKRPADYIANNSEGTLTILEKLRSVGYRGKLIYASSAEVYGNAQRSVMDEEHPLDPLSPYAVSKLAAEQMCKLYAQIHGLNVSVIRNFNTFGEFQRGGFYGGVIAKFKAQAKAGQPITVFGSGEQMRDYMHVSQAVSGYVLALDTRLPLIVNFGSGKPIRIIDIANFVSKKIGGAVTHMASRPGEIMRLEADVSRAKMHGYKVETDFWTHLEAYLAS